ncbi:MAG TPA: hypothetical protein VGR86_03905 [Steroidobacteraceae bacterium]|nr:hypothetical protein [Steroidobacteraceae bacterium]
MSRLKLLEARRRVLLARCDEQREELATRLAALSPAAVLRGTGIPELRHPLVLAAALTALLYFGRTRKVLTVILWLRGTLAFARRATRLVRLVSELRAPPAGG